MPVAPVRVRFRSDGEKTVLASFDSIEKRARQVADVQVREARRAATEANKAARTARGMPTGRDPYRGRSVDQDERRNAALKEREAKRLDKIRERSALMAGRYAKQQADAEIREAKRAARETAKATELANRKRADRGRAVAGVVGRAGRATAGSVAGLAGGIGLTAGTYAVGTSVMSAMALEEQAALLANATSMPGMGISRTPASLVQTARATALSGGVKAEDVMEAMSVVSARAGGARGLAALEGDLQDITKTARAAGVSMQDLGAVYAAALNAGVKPGEEMRQLMIDFVAQGKKGSIEFSDLSDELARLGGAGRMFGSGADMLRKVTGFAQIASETAIGKEQSRTVVIDMLREMTQAQKIKGMHQLGAQVAGEGGKLNDPAKIMADVIAGIEAGKTFGGEKGVKYGGKGADEKMGAYGYLFTGTSSPLAQNLRETFLKAGGGEAGKAAVIKRISDAAGAAGAMSPEERNAEFARVMETSAAKMAVETEKFKTEIAKLVPELTKLMPQVAKLVQGFAQLAVWVAKNPFEGVGALFAANIAKEAAASGAGRMLAEAMAGQSTLGKLGAVTMTAAAVYLTGKTVIDEATGAAEEAGKRRGGAGVRALNLWSRVRARAERGLAPTQEQLDEAAALRGEVNKAPEQSWWQRGITSALQVGGGIVGGTTGAAAGAAAGKGIDAYLESFVRANDVMTGTADGLAEINAALDEVAVSATNARAALDKVGNAPTAPGATPRNLPISKR